MWMGMEVIKLGAEYGQPLKKKSIFSLKKAKGTIFQADFLNIYVFRCLHAEAPTNPFCEF